jgi:hypothetical protein
LLLLLQVVFAFAAAFASLVVIPEGNLLLLVQHPRRSPNPSALTKPVKPPNLKTPRQSSTIALRMSST